MVMLAVISGYALVGIVFAVFFVLVGAGRLDSVARGTPLRVRLIWLPGAAALWPLLLVKWIREGEA